MNPAKLVTAMTAVAALDAPEDLRTVIDAANARMRSLVRREMLPGTHVSFEARGQRFHGTVVKHNPKSVQVKVADGRVWRVAPAFLTIEDGPVPAPVAPAWVPLRRRHYEETPPELA